MSQAEATTINTAEGVKRTLTVAASGGEVRQVNDEASYVDGLAALAVGDEAHHVQHNRLVRFKKASGVTFSEGKDVYWDGSANTAVNPGLALDGSADFYVGRCDKDAASGDDHVVTCLNARSRYERLRPIVFEFDCDGDNGDTDEHVLIPASQNPHGLLILGVFALVTEVFAGSSEDQGIVTIEDEDDNAICTLTASDAAADAANDVIVGTSDVYSATSGDAAKVVAAGKAVQGFVSQQTSGGTPAGKMKVYVRAIPLV